MRSVAYPSSAVAARALAVAFLLLTRAFPTFAVTSTPAEFDAEVRTALAALQPLVAELQKEIARGRLDQANERLVARFSSVDRTAAQAFVLGNMLYALDPKRSYSLHQEAAKLLPHEPVVLLEWAMEQHRVGEYAGALAAYDEYAAAKSEFAPVHGLAADCLLRLGRTRAAVERWLQSEKAKQGTLELFESLVGEIYRDTSLFRRREDLRARTARGEVDAAVQLIALDADFARDWWNAGPQREFLAQDLPLLERLPADPRIAAARCVGEYARKEEPGKRELQALLARHGYFIDAAKSVPIESPLFPQLLQIAIEAEVLSIDQARAQHADRIQELALSSKRPDLLHLSARLKKETSDLLELEHRAWDLTGDARFAVGYLMERLRQKSLSPEDAQLRKALRQFPEDSLILQIALAANPAPDEALLVQAIKAEYKHFSPSGLIPRPSAKPLRVCFLRLAKVLK
jgi:hypothetical protein